MKSCPTCNRTFLDDSQRFCLDDGATLVEESGSTFDPQATLALTGAQSTTPPSNPFGSSPGSAGSGAGQGSFGSGSGQGGFGSGSGQQAGSWSPTPSRFTPVTNAPAKKGILPWVLGGAAIVVVGIIGLIIVIAVAVNSSSNKNSKSTNSSSTRSSSTDVVLKSSDGKIQVSAPPSWKVVTDLNTKAELQVSNSAKEMYLIVLTDNKADYTSMDLDRHATGTLDSLTQAMTTSNRVGPIRLTINGDPAVQYEVRGEIKNLNVIYLHTTIETSTHYQQIVSWTLQSKYSDNEDVLKGVINSFKEN